MATANLTLVVKTCSKCGESLPAASFYRSTQTKDGLHSRCKRCHCQATSDYAKRNREQSARRAREWRQANPEKVREIHIKCRLKRLETDPEFERRRAREYARKNPDAVKAISARSRAKRKEKFGPEIKAYAAEYYAQNADKLKERAKAAYYRDKELNRPKVAQRVMRRNARKLDATPAWGSPEAIKAIYCRAAELTLETGVPHHVDHIVPLQSKHVCGLHVEFNLEVKPALDNVRKSNRWWPDCPDHVLAALPKKLRAELEAMR